MAPPSPANVPAVFILIPILLAACGGETTPEYCLDRADDPDCDGVPEVWDRCPGTAVGDPADRLGCSEGQVAGCSVRLVEPDDGARLTAPARFRWSGDCDVWLLQFSDDPDFPAGATRTAVRTDASQADASGDEKYWRVVGGVDGVSAGAYSPHREVKRWR